MGRRRIERVHMAGSRNKPAARKPRRPKAEAGAPQTTSVKPPEKEPDDEPINWSEIPGLEAAGQPNPEEVEKTANEVLDNVLRRFGWARDEHGRIEHVGEERPLKKAS